MDRQGIMERFDLPEEIEREAILLTFAKGDYLCKAGREVEYLSYILSGEVKISMTMANGKTLLRCFDYPGGVIGDLELMTNQVPCDNVVAVKETTCLCIPFRYCKAELLKQISFMNFIAQQLAKKLAKSSRLSATNQLYSLECRLCAYIANSNEDGQFSENLTELAELLGTSYRHLLRTLTELCEKSVLKKTSRIRYEIVNQILLEEMAKDCFME